MENFNLFNFLNEKVAKASFLSSFSPLINWLKSGNIFKQPVALFYVLIGIGALLAPFVTLIQLSDIFSYGSASMIVALIFIFLIMLVGGFFGIRYWIERSSDLSQITSADDQFVATPVISHLIQCWGEFFGTYVMTVGSLSFLVLLMFNVPQIPAAFSDVVSCVIGGFMMILVSRVIAELISAICAIANNTKK